MKNEDALYLRIYKKLLLDIQEGKYETDRLPTEKEIAQQFYVSRITARKAVEKLADNGIVVRISGRGTFVRNGQQLSHLLPVSANLKPLVALVMGGYSPSFGLEIANAAVHEAEEQGIHLIVKDTGNDQACEFKILEELRQSGVHGIIVQPAHGEMYSRWLINAAFDRYPIVLIDRFLPGIDLPFVGIDNERLSEMATNRLLAAGHRNISLITLEDETTSTLKARMEGFTWALNRHKIPVNRDLWLTGLTGLARGQDKNSNESYEQYMAQIVRHMRAHPEITAVFSTEYLVSQLAYTALTQNGYRIPEDYSLVGFDSGEAGLHADYIAYVRQPQEEMGRTAVQMICTLLRGEQPEKKRFILDGVWVSGKTIASRIPTEA